MERSPFCGVHGVKCENFTRYQKVKSRFSPGEKKSGQPFTGSLAPFRQLLMGARASGQQKVWGKGLTGYPETANSSRWGGSSGVIQPLVSLVCQWGRPFTRFLICKVGTSHNCLGWSMTCMKHLVKKRCGARGSPYNPIK